VRSPTATHQSCLLKRCEGFARLVVPHADVHTAAV